MKILLSTLNFDKRKEIIKICKEVNFIFPETLGTPPDVVEDGKTLVENAKKKSKVFAQWSNIISLADDTGLEVFSLNNEPGVYSARYAGNSSTYADNVKKLLMNLNGISNRRSVFKCVISVYYPFEKTFNLFEGITEGIITKDQRGENGFGYDPIFQPLGQNKTFAEMTIDEKNLFSHRKKALNKFNNWIKKYIDK